MMDVSKKVSALVCLDEGRWYLMAANGSHGEIPEDLVETVLGPSRRRWVSAAGDHGGFTFLNLDLVESVTDKEGGEGCFVRSGMNIMYMFADGDALREKLKEPKEPCDSVWDAALGLV